MSASATTAAKKRRANNGSNPMFKSPSSSEMTSKQNASFAPSLSENSTAANNIQRPMTLQQVITVFDNRLLTLEKSLLNNETSDEQTSLSSTTTTTTVKSDIDREYIEKMHQDFHDSLSEQVSEFDHRYQLLAKEVVDLKHIVLKLQSYTLDVNKALIEERVQILTTDDDNETLQIQPDDILDLHGDLQSMQQSMGAHGSVSEALDKEKNNDTQDLDENESSSITANENIQTEIVETENNTSSFDPKEVILSRKETRDNKEEVEKQEADDLAENVVSISE